MVHKRYQPKLEVASVQVPRIAVPIAQQFLAGRELGWKGGGGG